MHIGADLLPECFCVESKHLCCKGSNMFYILGGVGLSAEFLRSKIGSISFKENLLQWCGYQTFSDAF